MLKMSKVDGRTKTGSLWVKVDGHWTKSERSKSIRVDAVRLMNWIVQKYGPFNLDLTPNGPPTLDLTSQNDQKRAQGTRNKSFLVVQSRCF